MTHHKRKPGRPLGSRDKRPRKSRDPLAQLPPPVGGDQMALDGFERTPDIFAQMLRDQEALKRDRALALLAEARKELVAAARELARSIAHHRGRVTSTEVLKALRPRYAAMLATVDPRFMGVVFRGPGWRRLGWEFTGSHGRQVAIWELVEAGPAPEDKR